ncbi:MAG TPA: cobyric acid synthase [Dehalococcoidia bacterium]
MVQGTTSSAGKSLLVTALCRIFRQDGWSVAPFKAQNMSLNAYVTPDGGELGRAQAVQAEAAGIEPSVEMNPILLKPEADHRSQVVVRGRAVARSGARDYYRWRGELWSAVTESLDALRSRFELVVMEGAGSPAEPNLKAADIVNMRVARYAGSPVLLVGDIDRGGVFAAFVGTLELLEPAERALVRGFVINKFRGDRALLEPAVEFLTARTGVPVAGVVPYLRDLRIAEEDSVALDERREEAAPAVVDVAVVRLPRIANFDDFDPLAAEPGVRVRYVSRPGDLGAPDLVVLPGSKSTAADLRWLRESGLAAAVTARAAAGTAVLGICGGFQMLGEAIRDPLGVESEETETPGLGLLPAVTTFAAEKATHRVRARVEAGRGLLAGAEGLEVEGYEIHMGRTEHAGPPALRILSRSGRPAEAPDGALDVGGWVWGTYVHGLFAANGLRRRVLANLAARKGAVLPEGLVTLDRDAEYDRLAAHVRAALNMDLVYALLEEQRPGGSLTLP